MSRKVFEGVKVFEFSWAGVGPMMSEYLAEHGATVVHAENPGRLDVLRVCSPFARNQPTVNSSMFFGRVNHGKYGITLDLSKAGGMELVWRFVKWADIFAESFRPGAIKKWGLDYESVRKVKPDIIYFSTCMLGQWGPYSQFSGYGTHLAALGGFGEITGWPDRAPVVPYGAYIDFLNQRFNSTCVIAALEYKRRTGKGQYVEQAQYECGLQFLAPLFLDYSVNGRIANRHGNRDPIAAPHGVFPCKGDDRWIAIAVFDDKEWEAFCQVVKEPRLVNPEFATFLGRKRNEEELEKLIAEWTCHYLAEEVEAQLQAVGVGAQMVEKNSDLYEDRQLKHRDYFVRLKHQVMGAPAYEHQACYILSKTPREIRRPSPLMGEHNEYVYKELLGLTDDELSNYIADGAIPFPGGEEELKAMA